jgi:hypothetical protein
VLCYCGSWRPTNSDRGSATQASAIDAHRQSQLLLAGMAATRWPEAVIGASADEISFRKRNPLRMDFRDMVSSAAMAMIAPARGVRVHISDASPQGFCGHVTAMRPDVLIVTRDSGARELVILSRRRVTVVSQ